MEIVIYIFLLAVILPAAYAAAIGAPTVPSTGKTVKEALKAAGVNNGTRFYELGAGFGGVSKEALKMGASVTAYELSPFAWAWSFINLSLVGKPFRLKMKNFFKEDLSGAEAIYTFLIPESMKKLGAKLGKELKPGTRVISYAFPIEGWIPAKTILSDKQASIYIYVIDPPSNDVSGG